MNEPERLQTAVKAACDKEGVSIRALCERMPPSITPEQMSRWMAGKFRPCRWSRQAINDYFGSAIYEV
jgi:hypothetical protein